MDFGRRVQGEAVRMGLNRARKAYVIMDGGVCLWGVFGDRFANVAVGQRLAEGGLQLAELLRERGLADAEPLRRARDVPLAGDDREIPDVTKFHAV